MSPYYQISRVDHSFNTESYYHGVIRVR